MNKIAIIGLSGESVFMNVSEFPEIGETIIANSIHVEPGGKGYNQAVAVRRLKGECFFLSAVGNDYNGDECERVLKDEGVNYTLIRKNTKTAFATILTNQQGENQVIVYPGAKLELSDLDYFEKYIKDADVLLLQLEIPFPIIKKAIQIAKENHTYVILNPAPATKLDQDILNNVDLLTPNEGEAKIIFNHHINRDAVVTMGKDGAILYTNNEQIKIPPLNVKAIDSTGAGDCFNAALAVSIAQGNDLLSSCQFANIAAALSVTKNYVIDSLPTKEEVLNYLRKE